MPTQLIEPTVSEQTLEIAKEACSRAGLQHSGSAEQLSKILSAHSPNTFVLVFKGTMSGKSGLQRALFHGLPDYLNKKRVGVIWLTQKSSRSLIDQSYESLCAETSFKSTDRNDGLPHPVVQSFDERVVVATIMMSGGAIRSDYDLDKSRVLKAEQLVLTNNYQCDEIVFVLDESHIAVGGESQLDRLAKYVSDHALQHHYSIFGFTATPEIFLEGPLNETANINLIKLPAGSGYCGLNQLAHRFKQFSWLKESDEVPSLNEAIEPLLDTPGYIIIRIPVRKCDKVVKGAREVAGQRGVPVLSYTSEETSRDSFTFPIKEIFRKLDEKPTSCKILLLKDGLSAGDDLNRKNLRRYIIGWFEGRYKQVPPAVQAVGRNTGFHVTDTYPIFLSPEMDEAIIEHLGYWAAVPQSGELKSLGTRRKRIVSVVRKAVWNSIRTGTYEEYEDFCERVGRKPGKLNFHKWGLLENFYKGTLMGDQSRFINVPYHHVQKNEPHYQKLLREKYKLKENEGIWFGEVREEKVERKHRAVPLTTPKRQSK